MNKTSYGQSSNSTGHASTHATGFNPGGTISELRRKNYLFIIPNSLVCFGSIFQTPFSRSGRQTNNKSPLLLYTDRFNILLSDGVIRLNAAIVKTKV